MRRSLAAASCLLLALTACGGDSDPADSDGPARPGLSPTPTPASSGLGTGQESPTPGSGSTPGAPGAVAPPGASPGAPGAPRKTSAALPPSAGDPAPQEATAAGDYRYDSSGTVTVGTTPQPVQGTATLTVDPAVGGAQHSVLSGDQGRTEQDVLVRDAGTYLVRLQITNAAFDKVFEPSPAALLVPSPATVGKRWTWTARSTDGRTTVRQSSEVVRKETLTIGGSRVPTQVIRTALTLSGDITYDGVVTTWYAESLRLPVKDRAQGSGTAGGFPFSMDVTSTARSTRPS